MGAIVARLDFHVRDSVQAIAARPTLRLGENLSRLARRTVISAARLSACSPMAGSVLQLALRSLAYFWRDSAEIAPITL